MVLKRNKIVMIGFLGFSMFYLVNQSMWREDWKSLSLDLGKEVYIINSFSDPVKYYKPDIKIVDVRTPTTAKEIMVIPYGEEIHGVDHKSVLEKQGFNLKKINNYRGITSEVWHLGT